MESKICSKCKGDKLLKEFSKNKDKKDRIDSKNGYIKNNVQWVMLGINYMKLNYSNEELHKTLKLIKENYK